MLTIFLGDLLYSNDGVGNKVVPINIGFLAAYLHGRLAGQVRTRLFKHPAALLDAVQTDTPHIIGLSNYPWTRNLSAEVLKAVKRTAPSVVTVLGGPNYPHEPEKQLEFFAERPSLDFYTYMESEEGFLALVTRLADCGLDVRKAKAAPVPGVHFYDHDSGQLVHGQTVSRLTELDVIPSPYLGGFLDEFLAMGLQPAIQTTRGCPFTCTFCVEGDDYYTKVRRFSLARTTAELEYIARRVPKEISLDITDSNFGMYQQDLETCRVLRRLQDEFGWPFDINASSGKNKTETVVEASRLTRGAMSISLQVQSMDPEVLRNIRRKNISVESMVQAVSQTQSLSKTTRAVSAVIVPLPGETLASHLEGLRKLIALDMDYICPFTLMMLAATELANQRSRMQHGLQTKFRAIPNYYGTFGDVNAIEIEEVCIATNTMSFDDYLEARGFHFFMACYHADDNMLELRRYLGNFGISAFDWMSRMKSEIAAAPEPVRNVYYGFLQATRDELWDSEEELRRFWSVPENRERFVSGELGDNLFFKYRARAITTAFRDLLDFGAKVAVDMVQEQDAASDRKTVEQEVADVAEYVYRKRRLPTEIDEVSNSKEVGLFTYDLVAWEAEGYARRLCEFKAESPIVITCEYSEYQRQKLIKAYEDNGTSAQGISMLLRQHNPLFFVREAWRAAYAGIDMPVREVGTGRFDVAIPPGGSFPA